MLELFDMNDVITAVNAWKKEQAEIAARAEAERKRQAEKDAAMEAQKAALAAKSEQAAQISPEPPKAEPPKAEQPKDDAQVETYRLEITGTREALTKLREYGESLGISFKKNTDRKE